MLTKSYINAIAMLKMVQLCESVRDGKNIYYSISDERVIALVKLGQSIADGNTDKICTCEILKNEKYTENKEG